MRAPRSTVLRRIAVPLLAAVGLIAAGVSPAVASSDPPTYLALGDSVPFGYRAPTSLQPPENLTPDYYDPTSLIGYPDDIAGDLGGLHLVNTSCPGETSGSFINVGIPSNGCENGYRLLYPMKVAYASPAQSQLDFAVSYLEAHPNSVKLVTVQLGANDGILCQKASLDHCTSASEEFGVAAQVEKNLNTILKALRHTGYAGRIVVVTYYSLNYADTQLTQGTLILNGGIVGAALRNRVNIASGFLAFLAPSLKAGGSPQAAGLVYPNDIHPTLSGHQLLARAVEAVIPR